jgi:hypothetical protein
VEPLAAPAVAGGDQDEDPDATETNFITLACASDAECLGRDVCVFAPQADAGVASGVDAGVRLGSCKPPR